MFSTFGNYEGGPHMKHRHQHMRRIFRHLGKDLQFLIEGANEHRMRRGDVKFALLNALTKRPMHGYDIMKDLEEQYEGRYRPSPGSVYPTLQMLEDGGFVTSQIIDGKRIYEITEAGRKMLAERGEAEDDDDEDEDDAPRRELVELRDSIRKFMMAAQQALRQLETREARGRIKEVLDEARREIYEILKEE